MRSYKAKHLTYMALCVAAMTVMSQISIPFGITFITVQTFVMALTGTFLGAKRGSLALLVYILLGVVGVPVFAGFNGGIGVLLGYNGGFIIGFFFIVALCGLPMGNTKRALCGILGTLACHLLGVVWFKLVTGLGWWGAFVTSSLMFIIKDFLLVAGGTWVASVLKKRIVR